MVGGDAVRNSSRAETVEFPRPIADEERDLIEALLGAAGAGAVRFLGQLENLRVVGTCGCGCPSIDLSTGDGNRRSRPSPLLLADAESPDGTPVSVILWVADGTLSGLEVHGWDGRGRVHLPRPDTLTNLRTVRG
jgi:hypothetical protein